MSGCAEVRRAAGVTRASPHASSLATVERATAVARLRPCSRPRRSHARRARQRPRRWPRPRGGSADREPRLGPGRRRRLRRGAVRQAPRRDLRLPRPHAPRPRARRRPDPGRVRQGLPRYDTLEKPENARAWLYQIAHRVALDEIRRRKIVRFLPWTGESRGAAPSAEHLAMDARLSGDLQRALERIPERQRAALLLAELHDLTGLELAAALGVSHVAARALLTRARESLRQALAGGRARPRPRRGVAADVRVTNDERDRRPRRPARRLGEPARPRPRPRRRAARRTARRRRRRPGSTATSPAARSAPRSPRTTPPSDSSSARCASRRRSRRGTSGLGPRPRSSANHVMDRAPGVARDARPSGPSPFSPVRWSWRSPLGH